MVYTCAMVARVCEAVWPSPKSHRYSAMIPSGSEDAEASKLTVSGLEPVLGIAVKLAMGLRFPRNRQPVRIRIRHEPALTPQTMRLFMLPPYEHENSLPPHRPIRPAFIKDKCQLRRVQAGRIVGRAMVELDRIDVGAVVSAHPFVEVILKRLRSAGHEAVLIGGVVRDGLQHQMGRPVDFPPTDIDIATSALPDEIRRLFPDRQIVGLGEEFGVLLIVGPAGRSYEVATFRVEGEYDGRWPGKVELVRDLTGDVRRRDLTINGLAATADGEVIDLVGGVADLFASRIRAIGSPALRFAEDYLRMLRAIRFTCQIDGRIDDETAAAISAGAESIRRISNERIGEEILRILGTRRAAKGLALMDELGLLAQILPELTACKGVPQPEAYHPEGDVFVHTLAAVDVADGFIRDPIVKLSVVLHDLGKPAALERSGGENMGGHCAIGARLARDVGRRLRLSRQDVFRLHYLVRHHMRIADFPEMGRGKQVRFVSEGEDDSRTSPSGRFPLFAQLLQVLVADCEASAHRSSGWAPILRETLDVAEHIDLVCGLRRAREIVDGHVLMALGVEPGPRLGAILGVLHDRILAGQIETREAATLEARKMIAEQAGETDGSS